MAATMVEERTSTVVAAPRRRNRLVRVLLVIVAILVIGYIAACGIVADKLSHPTRKALTHTPTEYGMKYEDVQFNSTVDNIALKGWYIDSPGSKVIVMMHGRNSTRDGGDLMPIASALYKQNYDVLTFDFRAHGESGGERYSLGAWETRDVAGALNYLKGRGVQQVGTIAFSMGAATELLAAPDHPEMKALVSDSAYADLGALMDVQLPKNSNLPGFFNPGILLMVRLLYGIDVPGTRPVESMARLGDRPLFIIHGDKDDLVPVSQAYDLQKAAAADKNMSMWIVPGAGHTGSYGVAPQEYVQRVLAFYGKYLP
jgi:uncharacterized protein